MKDESVTIILPLPVRVLQPNYTVGSIGSRFMKAAATKRYRRLAKEAVEAEGIDTAPWERVAVEATFYHKDNRRRDQDNAMGSLKAAYDGIVDAGLVIDDDYEHMKRSYVDFEIDRENPRVMLVIADITEAKK